MATPPLRSGGSFGSTARIEARLERIEALLSGLAPVLENAPAAIATVSDMVDEVAQSAARAGHPLAPRARAAAANRQPPSAEDIAFQHEHGFRAWAEPHLEQMYQQGTLNGEKHSAAGKLASLKDTHIEDLLLNDEVLMAAGHQPGTPSIGSGVKLEVLRPSSRKTCATVLSIQAR